MSTAGPEEFASGSPVRGATPTDATDATGADAGPQPGTGLCLSGGGYRAMLFHLGVLLRLNEAGVLARLDRVSSVSGGSITAGVLAAQWRHLTFDPHGVATDFTELVVEPVRRIARTPVDVPAVLVGIATPARVSERVERKLRRAFFGDLTLADLPDTPRFVFNTTNLESGVLMRFSKAYLADYKVGSVASPRIPLAAAVTASAAFPPFLSPYELDGSELDWTDQAGNTLTGPGYRDEVYLTDGGVYDNLGLETVWKRYRTVLVSDAGGLFTPDDEPPVDWARGLLRVLNIIDSQVRALRRRITVDAFADEHDPHDGFFISTGMRFDDSLPSDHPALIPVDPDVTDRLARTPTRLSTVAEERQEQLVNWGYAAADAGWRTFLDRDAPIGSLPYPGSPIG